jgi:acid phosphatase family membrane protein YuiD
MLLAHQYPVIIPFVAILVAEVIKAVIDFARDRKTVRFMDPGGMPSGHSSFVTALAVTVAFREGVGSTAFMIASVIALIVMYDAINLRNQAGLHAKAINRYHRGAKLEESLGHSFFQVVAGALVGAMTAALLLNF